MPQIKQCYSLLDRREDDVLFVKKSQNKSTSVAIALSSTVTMTTAPSQVKGLPSKGVDTGCIVYISKSAAQTPSPGASAQPRAGYLLPVYKPDTKQAAYAFLPTGAQLSHRTGDKASLEARTTDHKSNICTSVAVTSAHSHPLPHSTTGLKETHTASATDKTKFVPHSKAHPSFLSLYRNNTSHNSRVHSSYEPGSVTVTPANPSRSDSAQINGGLASSNGRNYAVDISQAKSQQHKATSYIGTSQLTRPESSVSPLGQSSKPLVGLPEGNFHYPAVCRTPEIVPNPTANTQDAIFNPMSLYVRARLVPREVVTVNHGVEPSPPLVEYIKTDAICDKELTKWNAKDVSNFIAATDCRDKADLFLEEVCMRNRIFRWSA